MGQSSQKTTGTTDQYTQTSFAAASPEEQALRQSFATLGTGQQQGIQDIISRAMTGGAFDLSPADQQRLNQAFNAANMQFDVSAKQYADQLAGGRGLRMSDTPVAQQAIQMYGLGKAQLASDQAMQGLNLGLLGNQYRNSALLGAAGAFPSGSAAAFNPLFQERLASGLTHQYGTTTTNQTQTPSLMSQIGQGIGLAGSIGAMGAGFMGGIPGLSGTNLQGLSGAFNAGMRSTGSNYGPGF